MLWTIYYQFDLKMVRKLCCPLIFIAQNNIFVSSVTECIYTNLEKLTYAFMRRYTNDSQKNVWAQPSSNFFNARMPNVRLFISNWVKLFRQQWCRVKLRFDNLKIWEKGQNENPWLYIYCISSFWKDLLHFP